MRSSGVRRGMWRAASAALMAVGLGAAPAAAQFGGWGATWVGVAETSGDETTLLLGSGSFSPEGLGLRPTVGLQALYLIGEDNSYWSVTPSVGAVLRGTEGSLAARVGYAFHEDTDVEILGAPDAGDDATWSTSVQGDYWNGGAYGLQGIASYNWGSEYLWSRARATVRVLELDMNGSIHVGPEFVYQGEMGDETIEDPHYQSMQAGGIVIWNSGNMLSAGFGGGWKQNNAGIDALGDETEDESTWYVKLEFVLR